MSAEHGAAALDEQPMEDLIQLLAGDVGIELTPRCTDTCVFPEEQTLQAPSIAMALQEKEDEGEAEEDAIVNAVHRAMDETCDAEDDNHGLRLPTEFDLPPLPANINLKQRHRILARRRCKIKLHAARVMRGYTERGNVRRNAPRASPHPRTAASVKRAHERASDVFVCRRAQVMHASRKEHARRRQRGPQGRFLGTAEREAAAKADPPPESPINKGSQGTRPGNVRPQLLRRTHAGNDRDVPDANAKGVLSDDTGRARIIPDAYEIYPRANPSGALSDSSGSSTPCPTPPWMQPGALLRRAAPQPQAHGMQGRHEQHVINGPAMTRGPVPVMPPSGLKGQTRESILATMRHMSDMILEQKRALKQLDQQGVY